MKRLIAFSLLSIAPLLLSACGSGPLRAQFGAPSPAPDAGEYGESVAPPANPFLEGRRPVSAQAQRRFEQALAAIAAQQHEQALVELHHLVERYPELSGPALNLALLYQQRGELELAEKWFRRSVATNATNITAWNQYGIFLRGLGRFQEAERAYLEALAVWEWHADTHRNLGVLYDLYMGDREQALQHFHRYQALTGADDRAVAGWIVDIERQLMLLVQKERL